MSVFPLHKSDLLSKGAQYLSLLVAGLGSILFLKTVVPPYPPIAALWLAACVVNAGLARLAWVKLFWLNAASACILFGLVESYLFFFEAEQSPVVQEGTMDGGLMRPDEVLGYAPKAGAFVTDRRRKGNELMWDVAYTIDDHGLRVTPQPDNLQHPIKCVLFFGGSYTFGTGVSDKQTMPYQVMIKSNPEFEVFNLGVGGYGPHQMLAALEHDLVKKLVDCDHQFVTHVIYQAIWQHAFRVAGLVAWDRHGPSYTLNDTGAVTYRGHFDDGLRKIWRTVAILAIRSEVLRRFMGVPKKQIRRHNADDLALYAAVVARARDLVHSRFPCATFHVVFWDSEESESEVIVDHLSGLGLTLHRMSAILPNYDRAGRGGSTYKIHPQDGHPNGLAHKLIADFVVEKILPDEPRCDRPGSRGLS